MWFNQAVQRNYVSLQEYPNVLLLEPSEGILACDEIGVGKIPPNDLIQLALTFLLIQNKNPFYRDFIAILERFYSDFSEIRAIIMSDDFRAILARLERL